MLREVGAEAATYCAVGDVEAWAEAVATLIREREREPSRWNERQEAGARRASLFTWREYVARTVELYREVLSSCV